MSFTEAVKSGFDNYVNFNGRASRPAYWWWFLFAILVSVAANIVGAIIGTSVIVFLAALAIFLPGLSVAVRRLHDTNRTGWWLLLLIIPIIGFIVLLIFFLQQSDPGENDYGAPQTA